MKRLLLILFLAYNIFFCYSFSSDPIFKHLYIEEGFYHNQVASLYQDEYGTIWMVTKEGICKYNGSTAEQLNLTDKNGKGIFVKAITQ